MPPYDFSCWTDMRPLCFDLIKGKRTPVSFKFVLHLKPEHVAEILKKEESSVSPSDIKALVLNIKYDGSELTCITATAFHSFYRTKPLTGFGISLSKAFWMQRASPLRSFPRLLSLSFLQNLSEIPEILFP